MQQPSTTISISKASQIQQAIRDGELRRLPGFCQEREHQQEHSSPHFYNVLWEQNASGWTAVHCAVSHFLPIDWYEWILLRAASTAAATSGESYSLEEEKQEQRQQNSEFVEKNPFFAIQTALGQTVFDIFFCSYWNPLPWQSTAVKTASKRLIQACAVVRNHTVLLQAVYDGLLHTLRCWGTPDDPKDYFDIRNAPRPYSERRLRQRVLLTTAVKRVQRFLLRLMMLCRAVATSDSPASSSAGKPGARNSPPSNFCMNSLRWMIPILARNGSCPGMVMRLLLTLGRMQDGENEHYPRSPSAPSLSVVKQQEQARRSCMAGNTTTRTAVSTTVDTTASRELQQAEHSALCIWAAASTHYPDQDGMLLPLLEMSYLETTTLTMALQRAVASGKSWSTLQPLLWASPDLFHQQHYTNCFLPALAAMASPPDLAVRARQQAAGEKGWLVSLLVVLDNNDNNNPNSNNKIKSINTTARQGLQGIAPEQLEKVREEWLCERLGTIFCLLLAYPQALEDARVRS